MQILCPFALCKANNGGRGEGGSGQRFNKSLIQMVWMDTKTPLSISRMRFAVCRITSKLRAIYYDKGRSVGVELG